MMGQELRLGDRELEDSVREASQHRSGEHAVADIGADRAVTHPGLEHRDH